MDIEHVKGRVTVSLTAEDCATLAHACHIAGGHSDFNGLGAEDKRLGIDALQAAFQALALASVAENCMRPCDTNDWWRDLAKMGLGHLVQKHKRQGEGLASSLTGAVEVDDPA